MKRTISIIFVTIFAFLLVGCNEQVSDKVKKINYFISTIPKEVSLDLENCINEIIDLYDNLSKEEIEDVKDYQKLLSAKNSVDAMVIVNQINGLSEDVTLDDESKYLAIKLKLDGATPSVIAKVTNKASFDSKYLEYLELKEIHDKTMKIFSASFHENFVYKERLKIIRTEAEANEVNDFFINNLKKEAILSSYIDNRIFGEYALITGYINVSMYDGPVKIQNVINDNKSITVEILAEINKNYQKVAQYPNLEYQYFIIQVKKEDIEGCTFEDVSLITSGNQNLTSTYQFVNHKEFISNVDCENIHEFKGLSNGEKIVLIDSVESFDALKVNLSNPNGLDSLNPASSFFNTYNYIIASYAYSSSEYIVSLMGLVQEESELSVIISGNAPEKLEGMFASTKHKVFVIEVLKDNLEKIESYVFKNYNLYNGEKGSVFDNQILTDSYVSIDYDLMDIVDDLDIFPHIINIKNINELSIAKEHYLAGNKDHYISNPFLENVAFTSLFFEENNLVILNVTYPTSDGNIGIHELRDYGAYLDLRRTSQNSKDGFQSFDWKYRIFVISIPKESLVTTDAFSHSIEYLDTLIAND
ncbi:MAG: hypothetical protein WCY04_05005 [Bacilli bacterium]|jgi:hypothetical protein|nr:hypothetical protein [Acholeplasmataceae bacterium]MDY0364114.1 hypothetical protein [Bacilli bacterium]